MRVLVKLSGSKNCAKCDSMTYYRIWDTDDPDYSLAVCKYHSKQFLPSRVTFLDLIKVFNLVEWLIMLLVLLIIGTLIYHIIF